jgi:DNA-binding LytR/AlgR family response regulator
MEKYTCIIVDDQNEAVALICDHAAKIGELEVALATTDPLEAIAYLGKHKVDMIITDIEMPEITGLDLIESLRDKQGSEMPRIVLTTGYHEYALKGYEYGITDYLMKPVSFKRFRKSMDRVLGELGRMNNAGAQHDFFFADTDGRKIKIRFRDILYIEAARNYIIIVTGEAKHIVYRSMSSILEVLPGGKFIRVHKSYIMAIDSIESVRGAEIMLTRKNKEVYIPIGLTFKKEVLKKLNIG